jgi:ribosomal protein S18 acetylase RimI-like enzyme
VVALEGAEAVGTVRYEVKPDLLYVGRLAVLPAYRGRGVGAALMSYIERLAPSLGRTRIQLATRESIPGNIAFYERIGYHITEKVQHPRGPDIVVWFEKEVGESA